MRSKTCFVSIGLFSLAVLTACGPGPALGLGPALDPIVSLFLVVALLVGGYWAVKSASGSRTIQALGKRVTATGEIVRDYAREQTEFVRPQPSAEEILRERYARGEINRQQYLEIMEDIKKK